MRKNTSDKRTVNRLKTNSFTIEYKINNANGIYSGEVINLSAGGICFLHTSILEKGDILQIRFPFQTKKVVLTGEIVRIEGREVAVKFLNDERQIDKFVESFNFEFMGIKAKDGKVFNLSNDSEINFNKDYHNKIFNDIDKE